MSAKQGISKTLIVVTVLLLIVLLVTGCLQWSKLGQAQAALLAEELQLQQARQRLQALMELAKREQEFRETLALLEQLLPGEAKDEQLIMDMQSGADLSALRFTVIRFGERAANGGYFTLPLNLSFEGRFHGLLNLLEYMLAYERALRLEEIMIVAAQQVSEEEAESEDEAVQAGPQLNVQIKASAFYSAE